VTPETLADAVRTCLLQAVEAGELRADVPDRVTVERPRNRDHGDWSTNVALQLAKGAGVPPRQVGELLAERLRQVDGVERVDVAGPGFLNVTVDAASAGALARTVVEAGAGYGVNSDLAGEVVNLEFVSANPTGPLHIGHTRWAALGDALARLLRAAGADVTTEFYVNDAGAQMDRFGASVLARAAGRPVPEGGYHGGYVDGLAHQVLAERPDLLDLPEPDAVALARDTAYRLQMAEIEQTLADFDVHFDVFFSERSLHESQAVEEAVARLREQGHVDDTDGAVWLRTTDFGDDKDRVMVRANGEPTYFASDAAYYLSKKDRGFPRKIYLLGADHHGYVKRLQAIAACAGDDPASIEVLIGQLVDIGGARMSKRAGNIVELRDLVEWIGKDSVRYSLARYPADSPLSLDAEEMRKQTNDNPVFYVQYAHARTANVARNAATVGVRREDGFDASLLDHPSEEVVLASLAQFPGVVAQAATLREPHRVARYLEELAGSYHRWYDQRRVVPSVLEDGTVEPVTDVQRTRLWLNDAVRTVLANGLALLGVSAPERM
jgi:arginyl-tRNA synthetase